MVEIKINDSYKFRVEKDNWILVKIATVQDKTSKNYGQEYEVALSFNHNLTHAMRSAIHHMEADRDASYVDLKEYLDEYMIRSEVLIERVLDQRDALREAGEINKATTEVPV